MNRARERVRDDAALVGEVASKVSNALGLDQANRTLGRSLVIAGLDSNIAAISAAASEAGGDVRTDAAAAVAAAAAVGGGDGHGDAQLELTGEAAFRKAAKAYGSLGDSLLSDVFGKVTTRLRGSLVQLQAMQEEENGGGSSATAEDDGGGLAGFGKSERLSGVGVGRALKGGLVKRHTFQVRLDRANVLVAAWERRDGWAFEKVHLLTVFIYSGVFAFGGSRSMDRVHRV